MGKHLATVLLITTLLTLTACPRPKTAAASEPGAEQQTVQPIRSGATEAVPVGPVGSSPVDGTASRAATPIPSSGASPASARQTQPAQPLPVKTDTGMTSLIAVGTASRFLPEDFKIGMLSAPSELAGDEKSAISAVETFLAALIKGKVAQDMLAPETSSAVSKSLSFALSQGNTPSSYRIGRPKKKDGGEIAFNVRLFGEEGTAEGEIYVSSVDKRWLVSDFQISLTELAVKREKANGKFFPSSYRWLLGE